VIGVTETWLKSYHTNGSVKLDGTKIFRNDSPIRRGGGKLSIFASVTTTDYELLALQFTLNNISSALVVVYVPNKLPVLEFLDDHLSDIAACHDGIILMGDFNIDFCLLMKEEVSSSLSLTLTFLLFKLSLHVLLIRLLLY
jgi:hypothetical protein